MVCEYISKTVSFSRLLEPFHLIAAVVKALLSNYSADVVCNGTGDFWTCCTTERPCPLNEGDCNYDEDCFGNLKCGDNNCPSHFVSNVDCCFDPMPSKQYLP